MLLLKWSMYLASETGNLGLSSASAKPSTTLNFEHVFSHTHTHHQVQLICITGLGLAQFHFRLSKAPVTFSGGLRDDASGLHSFMFLLRRGQFVVQFNLFFWHLNTAIEPWKIYRTMLLSLHLDVVLVGSAIHWMW